MTKAVITGANGFIGSALTNYLAEQKVEVLAVVRNAQSNISRINNSKLIKIVYRSLYDIDGLDNIIERDYWQGSVFYHFAWQGVSGLDATDYNIQLKNVEAACNAINVAERIGCSKFIFASSIMEYEVSKLMETELECDLRNIYRSAKLSASYFTRIISKQMKLRYSSAIISNVYGPGEISERFINSTIRKMLRGEKALFSEANQLYDFIYIDDAVKIIALIGDKGKNNRKYYVGYMEPRPLKNYIFEIRNCIDSKLEIGIGEYKDYVGVSLNYDEFDLYSVKRDFGFLPQYNFKQGIEKTVNWLRGQMH